ncbi:MAG: ATP synthase F1 subunit delta [Proteobacteria bacterium]|nr:ATP synthase F1 subunit delta [Pseudomonadota bacterium]
MKGVLIAQSKISVAYAKGLFLLLREQDKNTVNKIYDEFKSFLDDIGDKNTKIYKELSSPLIKTNDKVNIIKNIFDKKMEKLLMNFITLIIEKGRFNHIYEIYEACLLLRDENDGVVRGEIRVAKTPDKNRQDTIIKSLSDVIGKKILAKFVEDEAVIAGFVTLMGTHYVDYSLSNHLKQMETELNRS